MTVTKSINHIHMFSNAMIELDKEYNISNLLQDHENEWIQISMLVKKDGARMTIQKFQMEPLDEHNKKELAIVYLKERTSNKNKEEQ